MKKRSIFMVSFALAILLVAGGVMAWFTAESDDVINSFQAGTLEIELIDEFDEEAAQNVNPGDSYDKEISVRNDGSKRAYVRIELEALFEEMEDANLDLVSFSASSEKWIYHDGFYYYNEVLEPGQETEKLVEEVIFAGAEMGNEYQGAIFKLIARAEAIQVTNGAALDAWGVDPEDL
ncbi:MAG TPA: TasA family protein [Syntrophomonadaceae bacterium]|nr:TasA family protein [Syntrophomonadaceae bacterium]